jgi:hypothetical protein
MKSPDRQLSALGIPLTKLGYNSLKTSAIGTTTRRGRSQSFAAAVATFTLVPSWRAGSQQEIPATKEPSFGVA